MMALRNIDIQGSIKKQIRSNAQISTKYVNFRKDIGHSDSIPSKIGSIYSSPIAELSAAGNCWMFPVSLSPIAKLSPSSNFSLIWGWAQFKFQLILPPTHQTDREIIRQQNFHNDQTRLSLDPGYKIPVEMPHD